MTRCEGAPYADLAWLADILPPPPARVLDAGCGEGALSRRLADAGYAVTAIDADPAAVAAARSRLLRPGGTLVLDEYAWDWADDAAIRWYYDIAAILAAADVIDPPTGGDQLLARWRSRHTIDGAMCNGGTP